MRSSAIKLMFKYNQRKCMKEKPSDINFNKIHLSQKHGIYRLTIDYSQYTLMKNQEEPLKS